MSTISRRSLAKGAAWSVPAVAVASAAPAVAASPITAPTDLAIEVADPPVTPDTGEYALTSSLYVNNTTTVATKASLTPNFIVTNVGSTPAVNPKGTVDLQVIDYATNVPSPSFEATKFNIVSQNPLVTFTPIARLDFPGSGNNYAWTYNGTLAPGESFEVPLKYTVTTPYAHATAEQMLVSAFVEDEEEGDWDDNSARTNYIPSFSAWF